MDVYAFLSVDEVEKNVEHLKAVRSLEPQKVKNLFIYFDPEYVSGSFRPNQQPLDKLRVTLIRLRRTLLIFTSNMLKG